MDRNQRPDPVLQVHFDLLLAADGVNSVVRHHLEQSQPRFKGEVIGFRWSQTLHSKVGCPLQRHHCKERHCSQVAFPHKPCISFECRRMLSSEECHCEALAVVPVKAAAVERMSNSLEH